MRKGKLCQLDMLLTIFFIRYYVFSENYYSENERNLDETIHLLIYEDLSYRIYL